MGAHASFDRRRCRRLRDPTPILEQAIVWKAQAEKTNIAVEEANHLRTQIGLVQTELADLKNQDVTIRQLRDTIAKLEEEKVKEVEKAIEEIERELRDEFSVRDHETTMRSDKLKAENAALEKKVSELEALMRDAQRRLDTVRVAADRKEALENEQIDILTRDLNDANRRVISLESELSRVTVELAEARASSQRGGLEDIAALGGLMKEKDEQIARLTEENRRLQDAAAIDAKKARAQCDELTTELNKKTQQVQQLEALLADQSDYEAIKKELRLLREIEFGEAATANEDSIARLGETVQSLDRLLAAKNRRLQNDNALLRQANEQYQGDEVMQAILAGSHQAVVEAVTTRVGREVAEGYVDKDADQIRGSSIPDIQESGKSSKPDADDEQNLFKILMNMGTPVTAPSKAENGNSTSRSAQENSSSSDIPFEHFRYSPKLTNYTGEPAKTPQELKAIQELQIRVASNVRALGGRALNTAEIARQCKRLMVAYNIGQRLFAKYVMNQSQGSLSELLSKPRHWSKLTDKGREAFRRIYGWISDAEAVDLLCSLSPRRVWPSEVRIEHPTPESLWESNSNLLPPEEPDENAFKRATSAREDQYRLAGTNQAANAGSTTRNSRWRHDDIPKEKIMSIFQTELAKLREQESTLERAIATRSFASGHVRRTDEPVPAYHEMSHNERMASISHAHQVMNARMRVGLSPITQDQFEMFGHIDTEDVVKQIKEFLSMNSISQRQFGEHVLGLSQGSVSDLLARPKQWNMLTQKGREPFIRMKLFMHDVVQSASRARAEAANKKKNAATESLEVPTSDANESASETAESVVAIKVKREVPDEEEDVVALPRSEFDAMSVGDSQESDTGTDGEAVDTALLVRKVKDRLHLHGISQRLFGEAVLGISAGGCSELFLRPRRWSTLSVRGREPFEKMRAWLADKDAVQRLLVKERIEAGLPLEKNLVNGNGKRLSDPPYEPPPRKVQRTIITEQQKEALRFVFQHEHHPSQKTVELVNTLAKNETELNQLRQDNFTQKELIEKLEADLAAAVAGQSHEINGELSTMDMLGAVHETKLDGDTNSVLTIVLAQRDRLKLRVGVLEEELMAEKTKQAVLQTEIEKVREDNVKLYGKIRFLQGYGSKSAETSVPLPEESNYSAQYEKRLDPFQRFGQAETQRTYARLPIHDRASLSIGKAIMTSASARMTFFFYLVFLHLLVFLVLYRFAYFESCERDFQQDCVAKFERHMKEHHPGNPNG
ncbi:CUT domain protein [Necator americanus]|uniref:CUT domain protein n=1 Tax=Necator americanus TaxID=51031 RepID=W2SKM5_NECAM|nr:CUT domain protein [Necator americanus]ETN69262.1 CUT domain protein [Necator americanus]